MRRPLPRPIWLFPALCLAAMVSGAGSVAGWLEARPYRRDVVQGAAPRARPPAARPRSPEPVEPSTERTPRSDVPPPEGPAMPPSVPTQAPGASLAALAAGRAPTLRAEVLVAGLDRRPGRPRAGRTDSLLLLFLEERPGRPGRVGIVSLPRDLYVEVPGHGPARINATLRIARRLHVDGPDLLRRVVEDTLRVTVGHVVLVDLAGFEAMVDAVGGVRVAVRCPIVDDFEDPRTSTGRRVLDIPAGPEVPMDGATAAMYVRSRHGRSDFSRARRQQAVVQALVRRAREPASLLRLPALLEASEGLFETSATRAELLRLAQRVIGAAGAPVRKVVLDARVTTPHRTPEGRAVLRAEPDALRAAVQGLFASRGSGDRPAGSPCPAADVALTRR